MRVVALLICLLVAFSAFAEDKISGYISGGVIVINTDDKLIPDSDTEDANFNTLTKIGAMISGEVSYKPNETTKFHIGIPRTDIIPKFEMGVSKRFDNKVDADFSILANPLDKEWENPYISKRNDTKAESYGASLKLKRIAGTGFFTDVTLMKHNVIDDKAEKAYPTLGRDGHDTEIKAGYTFGSKRLSTDIFAKYVVGDRKGEAESFKSYGTGIKVTAFTKEKNLLIFLLAVDRVEFDADNPYFSDTREETSVGALALYTLNDAFGYKDKFITFSGGYGSREANIDFFDAESFFAGVGAGLNF
jgi:hypothetical protein